MKPLSAASAATLLERIDYARESELRFLTMLNPTAFTLRLSVQDTARGFDWIDVIFEINGVRDARLADDNKLKMMDMSGGISIVIDGDDAAIGLGEYASVDNIANAPLFLLGTSIKFEEAPFSG